MGRVTRLAMIQVRMNASSSAMPPPTSSAFSICLYGASSTSSERRNTAAPTVRFSERSGSPVTTNLLRSIVSLAGGMALPVSTISFTPVTCCMPTAGAFDERASDVGEAKMTPALVVSAMLSAKASSMFSAFTR